MTAVRPLYLPPGRRDELGAGRLILRDGSTAELAVAAAADRAAFLAFFHRLSPRSQRRRFFSAAIPRDELVATLCGDAADPRRRLTLIATRTVGGERRDRDGLVPVVDGEGRAEVAMAVDDAFQGQGLGTLLLERLALTAARHGITHLWGVTHAENRPMLEVFEHLGYPIRAELGGGEVEVDLAVMPTQQSVARQEARERIATTASLRPLLEPRSVAVVGASRDPQSIGARVLDALLRARFCGPVYAVNPSAKVVGGIQAYPSVRALPEPVDLAVIAVPAAAVPSVVDDAAARGVPAVLVISAGFSEVGDAGAALQRAIVDAVRGHGMRLVGPNCMGLLNTDPTVRLNASFSPVFPPAGNVAMLSQSGALGLAILDTAERAGLGLSSFVSVGNRADVSANDLLQFWEEDARTRVILLYIESFGNPRRFARIARRVGRSKPIVVVKGGRTGAGRRAASSHTAALAASDVAADALFRQTGVIRADSMSEMLGVAALLGAQPLPTGPRVAIVTNAGGPAILAADALESAGLQVPELAPATRARLRESLPPNASAANPIDMIAQAGPVQFRAVVETALLAEEVDAVIAIYIPADARGTAAVEAAIAAAVAGARAGGATEKPVAACLMAATELRAPLATPDEKIPVYAYPEQAARALASAHAHAEWRARPPGAILDLDRIDGDAARAVAAEALARGGAGWLDAGQSRRLLEAVGIGLAPGEVARTSEEAVAAARRIGFPVAVKLASTRVLHKSERGGVRLDLANARAVEEAFAAIRARMEADGELDAMDGVLVQRMVKGGIELMVGATSDPVFGPLVAFGLGGIHVEVLGDVVFRVTPLTDADAAEMVREIRGRRLLEGYRGRPPADVAAIEQLLLRVSRLVEEVPEIVELDGNPVVASPPGGDGCVVVDARVRVASR